MKKIVKGIELKLSCYKCGGVIFENIKQDYTNIEDMYFLENPKSIFYAQNIFYLVKKYLF